MAILEIDGLAIFCVVAEMPVVGDVVHGDVTAIVEKVRVTSAGHVVIEGRRATLVLPEMRRRRWSGESKSCLVPQPSPRGRR